MSLDGRMLLKRLSRKWGVMSRTGQEPALCSCKYENRRELRFSCIGRHVNRLRIANVSDMFPVQEMPKPRQRGRNVCLNRGKYFPVDTALYHTRLDSSSNMLWGPQNLCVKKLYESLDSFRNVYTSLNHGMTVNQLIVQFVG